MSTIITFLKNKIVKPELQFKNNDRLILAYHRVIPAEIPRNEYIQKCMWISPKTFEEQILGMQKVGQIVSIERILDFKRENTRPLFALTFDDGWRDNYTYAFPILKKYGLTATIFIATAAVNTGRLFWPEEVLKKTDTSLKCNKKSESEIKRFIRKRIGMLRPWRFRPEIFEITDHFLEYLKELDLDERIKCINDYYARIGVDQTPIKDYILSWDEILEMDKYGINFGSHTHNHAILKYCSDETIINELLTSKNILEEKLKKPINMFCYPNARFNETNANLLRQTGYRYGFKLYTETLKNNYSNYFIPRILMNEASHKKLINLYRGES